MENAITRAIAGGLSAAFLFIAIAWIIGIATIVSLAALITLVVKKVWQGTDKKGRPAYTEDIQQSTTTYKSQQGEWSPTGWIYDQNKQEWQPPDYLRAETKNRWKWDEEKRIWIDLEKGNKEKPEIRPTHPKIKIVRNGPTFEEWKAEKEKQNPRD